MKTNNFPDGNDPNNPVRIFTDGVFDMFHFGHARVLEQCKKKFKHVYLVVGVCSDEDTTKYKGKPVMTAEERAQCVMHCKWVDQVWINSPWHLTIEFIDQTGCHYMAHDPEPYPMGEIEDLYAPFKVSGRFLATKRTNGISSTDLIYRVIRSYDTYLERSVGKGLTAKDLNISDSKFFVLKLSNIIKCKELKNSQSPTRVYFSKWKSKTK